MTDSEAFIDEYGPVLAREWVNQLDDTELVEWWIGSEAFDNAFDDWQEERRWA